MLLITLNKKIHFMYVQGLAILTQILKDFLNN